MFKEYAHHYDLCNSDKEYNREANYVDGMIRQRRPGAKSVLDLGSGTGTHAHLLAQKGYNVLGVELSREMANIANAKFSDAKSRAEIVCSDIRNFRVDRKFDVVTSLFHVMSYQTSNEDFLSALKTAHAHLNKGGLFIFDIWYGPAVLADRPHVRVKRVENSGFKVLRIAEPKHDFNENTVEVNYTIQVRESKSDEFREFHESHLMRYFFLPEVREMLRVAEFKLVDTHGWLDNAPLSEKTWGACFIVEAL